MGFKNPSNMSPMVRTAIWTTLLACPSASTKDGMARNIVKTDIEKLRSSSVIAKTIEVEALLLDSWSLHQKQPSHHMDNCFGRLCIRCMVHVLNKGPSATIENKTYESLAAIVACFAKEVHEPPSQKASSASASTDKVVDLISAKPHHVAMLQNSHMNLNGMPHDLQACLFAIFCCRTPEYIDVHMSILKYFDFSGTRTRKTMVHWSFSWWTFRTMVPP